MLKILINSDKEMWAAPVCRHILQWKQRGFCDPAEVRVKHGPHRDRREKEHGSHSQLGPESVIAAAPILSPSKGAGVLTVLLPARWCILVLGLSKRPWLLVDPSHIIMGKHIQMVKWMQTTARLEKNSSLSVASTGTMETLSVLLKRGYNRRHHFGN